MRPHKVTIENRDHITRCSKTTYNICATTTTKYTLLWEWNHSSAHQRDKDTSSKTTCTISAQVSYVVFTSWDSAKSGHIRQRSHLIGSKTFLCLILIVRDPFEKNANSSPLSRVIRQPINISLEIKEITQELEIGSTYGKGKGLNAIKTKRLVKSINK